MRHTLFRPGRWADSPRRGLTLMEVLVAIFIMAIGMLALLTLFPLGALRMEQAIRDEKCALAGMQAIELAKILNFTSDPTVRLAMTDVNAKDPTTLNPLPPGSISTAPGPSKAVVVDPLGFGVSQYLDPATQNLARVQSNYASNYYDFFTLTDDLVFQAGTGLPRMFGGTVGNEVRYSWSYVLQQPTVQNPGVTNYTICIYNRRPLIGPLEFTIPAPTPANPGLPSPKLDLANSTVTYTVTDPTKVKQVLPGQWLLDATLVQGAGPNAASGGPDPRAKLVPLANFYRIVNVRQGTNASETVLDLQTQFRGYSNVAGTTYPPANGVNPNCYPVLIIQDSLVEVIEVGPLR